MSAKRTKPQDHTFWVMLFFILGLGGGVLFSVGRGATVTKGSELLWFRGSNGKLGFHGRSGFSTIDPQFNLVVNFAQGWEVTPVLRHGTLWELIDSRGNQVCDAVFPDFGWARITALNDLVPAGSKGNYGFVDARGNWKISAQFTEVTPFSGSDKLRLAGARKEGKWGFIDRSGQFVIAPAYDAVLPFREEEPNPKALVKSGESWMFIDAAGKLVQPIDLLPGETHFAWYCSTPGVIDASGTFSTEHPPLRAQPLRNGFALILLRNRELGLISESGVGVARATMDGRNWYTVTAEFERQTEALPALSHGNWLFRSNGMVGVIDPRHGVIVPPKFESITEVDRGFGRVYLARRANQTWTYNLDGSSEAEVFGESPTTP